MRNFELIAASALLVAIVGCSHEQGDTGETNMAASQPEPRPQPDQDRWESYSMRTPDGLVVTHVNLNLVPDASLDTRLFVEVAIQQPGDHGLPGREEDRLLWDLEDAIAEFVESAKGGKFAGRTTHGGKRIFCYYVTADMCPAAADLEDQISTDYQLKVSSTPDAQWDFYREFLYPSDDEMQQINAQQSLPNQ